MIIFQFLSFWVIAAALFFINPRNKANRWVSMSLMLCGFSVLFVIIRDDIMPVIENGMLYSFLKSSVSVMKAVCICITPYTGVIAVIYYSCVFNRYPKFVKLAPMLFLPIPLSMFIIFPIFPMFNPSFVILSLWVVPYMSFICVLCIISVSKEKEIIARQDKIAATLLIVPIVMFSMYTNYIAKAFGHMDLWKYNTYIVLIWAVAFIYLSTRYGVAGFRLRIEKKRMDSTIQALNSGTAIFTHSIKNEILKLSISMSTIERILHKSGVSIEEVNENIKYVKNTTEHLMFMVKHIYSQVEDIQLNEEKMDLDDLIKSVLECEKPLMVKKQVILVNSIHENILIKADRMHITETLKNIIQNAIEALPPNGRIELCLSETNSSITLIISDNGKGISPENLYKIFDPFFSTKDRSTNFGLGLSYCYKVIIKHNWDIMVKSKINMGTQVYIKIPMSKIYNLPNKMIPKRSTIYG